MSAINKEQPSLYFATVSPSGVATNIYNNMPQPTKFLMNYCFCVFAFLRAVHSVETGSKRYVDAVSDEAFPQRFPSGSVVAPPSSVCPFWLGAAGPLTNQGAYSSYFTDDELQKEAAAALRRQ